VEKLGSGMSASLGWLMVVQVSGESCEMEEDLIPRDWAWGCSFDNG
jgi:hypothetical protein